MNLPTLSVIIPNYNHGHYIGQQLRAVLDQSYTNILEILVCDDCSTDNSVEVINGFIDKNPIIRILENEENQGSVASTNRLIQEAKGDYICAISADDLVLPDFFEKSIKLLTEYPEIPLCCSHPAFLDDKTGKIDKHEDWFHLDTYARSVTPQELVKVVGPNGLWIAGHTCIVKRDVLLEVGKYNPLMGWYCDWFIFHVIAFRYGICYIPEALSALRILPSSYSAMGVQNPEAEHSLIKTLVSLLKSDQYRDVLPAFRNSCVLDKFTFAPVLKKLLAVG